MPAALVVHAASPPAQARTRAQTDQPRSVESDLSRARRFKQLCAQVCPCRATRRYARGRGSGDGSLSCMLMRVTTTSTSDSASPGSGSARSRSSMPGRSRADAVTTAPIDPGGDERRPRPEQRHRRRGERERQRQEPDRDQPVEARDPAQELCGHVGLLERRPHDRPGRLEHVEDEAGEHQLPGRGREAVPGDGERRERPGGVDERDAAARLPALAHHQRASDRAEPSCCEHEPERLGRAVDDVLHHVGQEHLGRARGRPGRRRRPRAACPTATRAGG